MRILMAATGEFALPTFSSVLGGDWEVVGLVTQPDRPAGRGRHVHESRVKRAAVEAGVAVFQPEAVATLAMADQVAELAPDVFLVVAYGQKIPAELCSLPALGAVNLHGSLLPALRGAAPCNWAIINGLRQTGVSVIYLAERMDAGDILGQREVGIGPRETAGELAERLARVGADLTVDVLSQMEAGTVRAVRQDESLATLAPRLRKEDGLIDWGRTAEELDCLVRGLQPWPGAFTYLRRADGGSLRIIVEEAAAQEAPAGAGLGPGTVVESRHRLVVATGRGVLELVSVKPESAKAMTGAAFAHGHAVDVGAVLGSAPGERG